MYYGESIFEFVYKFPMSVATYFAYFASLVEMVLLRFIFIVASPAILVLVFPLYSSLLPPMVNLVPLTSSFWSQMTQ